MMTLTFNQTEKPADFEKFLTVTYPTFFFGFSIKNQYDQRRLKIKDEFQPKYVFHKYGTKMEEMLFLYGLTTPVTPDLLPCFYPLWENPNMNREQYEAVLNPLEVDCNNCYLFLSKNLYPIETFYAHRFFTKNPFKDMQTYSQMLERDPELPLHHTISSFHLFLLTNY
jgi:hypothetical protein